MKHHSFLPSKEWQNIKLSEFEEFSKFVVYNNKVDNLRRNTCQVKLNSVIERILGGVKPQFSTISEFSEEIKADIIEELSERIGNLPKGSSVDECVGTWIYGLLSMLDTPLSPHAYNCLRKLARTCIQLRSNLPPDTSESLYTPLNLFICIVGRYFKQFDLADS